MADPATPEMITDAMQVAREMPITEALYALKAEGKHPMARVAVGFDGSVRRVSLHIGAMTYYFHGTKDCDGNRLEPRSEPYPEWNEWFVPFDGYEASLE
jgi:hypothetical protein